MNPMWLGILAVPCLLLCLVGYRGLRLAAKEEAIAQAAAAKLAIDQELVTCAGMFCNKTQLTRGTTTEVPGMGFYCTKCFGLMFRITKK